MAAKNPGAKILLVSGFVLAFCATAPGQSSNALILDPKGGEFSVLGSVPGDQVLPSLSLSPAGGILVWQDNAVDKNGSQGIGGTLLGGGFASGPIFRVEKTTSGDQINPQAQLLANDMIFCVWQSSVAGTAHIYGRFAKNADAAGYGTNFTSADKQINTYTADQQTLPSLAALPDGSVMVVWQSYGEDGSLWGVYGRRMTPTGGKGQWKKQIQINQYTAYNQRNPAVAALANGNIVITWVSEKEASTGGIDIYARIFTPEGTPVTDETMLDSGANICATPAVAALPNGGFTAAWAEKDSKVATNGWDIWARSFNVSETISPVAPEFRVNTFLYGDQYSPKIAADPAGCFVVWTSLGQDGSREGVFGRYLAGGTAPSGSELQVNTTTISQQMHPTVAWNGSEYLAVWTSYTGADGFDLYGQAYAVVPP